MAEKEAYSPKEVATILGYSVSTIRKYIRKRKIRAFRINKRAKRPDYRISREEVDRLKDEKESIQIDHDDGI